MCGTWQRMLKLVAIKHLTTWAPHKRVWFLRGQLLAGRPDGIFPSGPIAGIAPFLKIRLGSLRQKHSPRPFEASAGLIKVGRGAVSDFPGDSSPDRILSSIPIGAPVRRAIEPTCTSPKKMCQQSGRSLY